TPLAAVEAVREAGAEVVAVVTIVDRATGAGEKIQDGAGVPYLYAYDKDELGLD
ncbi:orotate phosphoribosyltransferase, partial [Streptomyces sp. SID6648]|nr:orotate phosphoribosyltransferase [Streptomyces sp. SID6648]